MPFATLPHREEHSHVFRKHSQVTHTKLLGLNRRSGQTQQHQIIKEWAETMPRHRFK
ncbi:unnamed protein product [Penicillium roqueforti FM164]|uniref:Genomic scaffold, ProqFM164S02 n=1 Tax=Penicillium roqueforti (strain FM164) TaxID=1365484 RepID=W6Q3B7_PENRF|nr:unnamed protein product [Penicillium roqueforti FM164]